MQTSPTETAARRKRKWDEGPPPDGGDALVATATPDLRETSPTAPTLVQPRTLSVAHGEHVRELEINEHPGRRFAMMSANIKMVEARADVVIVPKGKYYPPNEPHATGGGDESRPLFLKVRAKTAVSLSQAISLLEDVMARGSTAANNATVWADMDPALAPAFDLLERLRGGPDATYIRYIEKESGARVELAGRGAVPAARDNLHFSLRGEPAAVASARTMCASLIRTIRPHFEEYRLTYYKDGPSPPPPRAPYAHGAPQQQLEPPPPPPPQPAAPPPPPVQPPPPPPDAPPPPPPVHAPPPPPQYAGVASPPPPPGGAAAFYNTPSWMSGRR